MADDKATVEFRSTVRKITHERYPSGRLKPVFKSILQDDPKHDEYIARMIARDRACERNWEGHSVGCRVHGFGYLDPPWKGAAL